MRATRSTWPRRSGPPASRRRKRRDERPRRAGGDRETGPHDEDVVDAELVDDGPGWSAALVPARPRRGGPRYLVDRHTVLGPGELPPTVEELPRYAEADFRISADTAQRRARASADNTRTHQDGQGLDLIRLHDRPDLQPVRRVRAWRDWLKTQGVTSGPVFRQLSTGDRLTRRALSGGPQARLSPAAVGERVQVLAERAGVSKPAKITSQGIRAGGATDLAEAGAGGRERYAAPGAGGRRRACQRRCMYARSGTRTPIRSPGSQSGAPASAP